MDGIKLLQKLVRIPSFSGREDKLAGFLADYCRKNRFPFKIINGNVVLYFKGKDKSKAVIFNAHLDTVDYGNRSKWIYPPTGKNAGKIEEGKLYGLGASDCKGAIASMLLTAKEMLNPRCDVWFTFVCCEETDGSGTVDFLKWFVRQKQYSLYKGMSAVIGEPTCLKSVEIGHRGNIFAKITVAGESGHSAVKYNRGKLAIIRALDIIGIINKKFCKWEKDYYDKVLGSPAVNFTQINTDSSSVNKTPDHCIIGMDIRTTPEFHGLAEKLLERTIGKRGEITYIGEKTPPGFITPGHPVVKAWKKLLPNTHLNISLGSTDQSLFLQAGIPAVLFGPGCKETMHQKNESIPVSNIAQAAALYKKFVFLYTGY